jgi:hypothetical protein
MSIRQAELEKELVLLLPCEAGDVDKVRRVIAAGVESKEGNQQGRDMHMDLSSWLMREHSLHGNRQASSRDIIYHHIIEQLLFMCKGATGKTQVYETLSCEQAPLSPDLPNASLEVDSIVLIILLIYKHNNPMILGLYLFFNITHMQAWRRTQTSDVYRPG